MNLIEPIHEYAKTRPEAPAIITPQRSISWSELDNLIWSTALKLSGYGLRAGDRVGISMAHPITHLVASLSLARIQVAHIAIPVSESKQVRYELLNKLELKMILSDIEELVISTPKTSLLNKLEPNLNISVEQKKSLMSSEGNFTWLILQSSGTTGAPKFAELSHDSANDRFIRFLSLFECNKDDIFFTASRPDFVVAKQRQMFSLVAGAAVFMPTIKSISANLVSFLNQYKITLACGTPSHLSRFISIGVPIPSLRVFEARSAFISERIRLDFKTKINSNLYIVYGTNEGDALTLANPTIQQQVPNTVGFATKSIEIEIVDIHGVPKSALDTGEVRVRGPGLVKKYLNNSEASINSFKNGWFYPGDLGYLSKEGALVLQGRKDDMMIFDGMNIYPAEIENVLASHSSVKEVAAFAVKHELFQDVPFAAVILNESVTEKDLIEFCKKLLGIKYPKRIFILKEFPRNQFGKILKRDLLSIVAKMISQ
jgi:cyanophycin synthetase